MERGRAAGARRPSSQWQRRWLALRPVPSPRPEVFQHLSGFSALAARRPAGVALWTPGVPWQRAESGPDLDVLPQSLWLVGLGHLGQAYLWTLSCLPYADPSAVSLTLQDDDRATDANRSTSPLTFQTDIGRRKTRIAADWMEPCGMETRLIERRPRRRHAGSAN